MKRWMIWTVVIGVMGIGTLPSAMAYDDLAEDEESSEASNFLP